MDKVWKDVEEQIEAYGEDEFIEVLIETLLKRFGSDEVSEVLEKTSDILYERYIERLNESASDDGDRADWDYEEWDSNRD